MMSLPSSAYPSSAASGPARVDFPDPGAPDTYTSRLSKLTNPEAYPVSVSTRVRGQMVQLMG